MSIPKLSGSVGYNGDNNPIDVITVRTLLNNHIALSQKLRDKCSIITSTAPIDKFNREDPTNRAIRMFQMYVLNWSLSSADGKVGKNGPTLHALCGEIAAPVSGGGGASSSDQEDEWRRVVDRAGTLKRAWMTDEMKEWLLQPPKSHGKPETAMFRHKRLDLDGHMQWKSWPDAYGLVKSACGPNSPIQTFTMYPTNKGWCTIRAGLNGRVADTIQYCNLVWNKAMFWYIIEKKSPPYDARVAFREVEEAFARVFLGGFIGLMGGFSVGAMANAGELNRLVNTIDKIKQYAGFIADKSFQRDKFLD